MSQDRIQILMAIHREFVGAASLPEAIRPYSVQGYLTDIEKSIMDEIKEKPATPLQASQADDDDIPF